MTNTDERRDAALSKVPAVTLVFWIIKIIATTLGETTPEAGAAGLNGYLVGTAIFGVALLVLVWAQIRARRFHPWLYWTTIVASTTAGTTLADFATRSLGIGYTGGSILLLALVLASLGSWRAVEGRIETDHVARPRTEAFYWLTITFSQTLGTALGDWAADDGGLGYLGGAALFGGLILLVAVLYRTTKISRTALFWAAFILTRPLGATLGDFFDKPLAKGGLDISRPVASLILLGAMILLVALSGRPRDVRTDS